MAPSFSASAAVAVLALSLFQPALSAEATVFHSQEEALELAFPEADRIDSRTYILSGEQIRAVEEQSRAELESELVTLFSGWRGDELIGRALIDVHTVRTMPEAFMIVLSPQGKVESLRVLAFYEPSEYMPTRRWYEQFRGADRQKLPGGLRVGRDVHGVVGATLSARAVTQSVRRALAFHNVLIAKITSQSDTAEPDSPEQDTNESSLGRAGSVERTGSK